MLHPVAPVVDTNGLFAREALPAGDGAADLDRLDHRPARAPDRRRGGRRVGAGRAAGARRRRRADRRRVPDHGDRRRRRLLPADALRPGRLLRPGPLAARVHAAHGDARRLARRRRDAHATACSTTTCAGSSASGSRAARLRASTRSRSTRRAAGVVSPTALYADSSPRATISRRQLSTAAPTSRRRRSCTDVVAGRGRRLVADPVRSPVGWHDLLVQAPTGRSTGSTARYAGSRRRHRARPAEPRRPALRRPDRAVRPGDPQRRPDGADAGERRGAGASRLAARPGAVERPDDAVADAERPAARLARARASSSSRTTARSSRSRCRSSSASRCSPTAPASRRPRRRSRATSS